MSWLVRQRRVVGALVWLAVVAPPRPSTAQVSTLRSAREDITVETPRADTGAFVDVEVEQPALAKSGNPAPRYPPVLQSLGVDGEVLIQFVIDTTGTADMRTFRVLRSTDPVFTSAVLEVLPRYRFRPAELNGCKVKMYVNMPFTFTIQHE